MCRALAADIPIAKVIRINDDDIRFPIRRRTGSERHKKHQRNKFELNGRSHSQIRQLPQLGYVGVKSAHRRAGFIGELGP